MIVLGLPLLAQQRKADVFGMVGYGKTSDDEGSLGGEVNGGGGIRYRLTRRLECGARGRHEHLRDGNAYIRPDVRLLAGDGGNGAETPFGVFRAGIGNGYAW